MDHLSPDSLQTEVILTQSVPISDLTSERTVTHTHQSLGNMDLDWIPQPGDCLEIQGQTYIILERRHRYQLKSGCYQLYKITLYVQSAESPQEKSLVNGRWILGDVTCRFNAHSELLRCAVNPLGPCNQCQFYESLPRIQSNE